MYVVGKPFQALFWVLSSFNPSLLVGPPDPWDLPYLLPLYLQGQGWMPAAWPASHPQPGAAIYSLK